MPNDWDHIRQYRRSFEPGPVDWPTSVRAISMEGLALLGIDDENRLYWDGKPIEIQRRLKFSRMQIIGAVIVGLATLIGGVGTGINEGFDFGCKVHWWDAGCSR